MVIYLESSQYQAAGVSVGVWFNSTIQDYVYPDNNYLGTTKFQGADVRRKVLCWGFA